MSADGVVAVGVFAGVEQQARDLRVSVVASEREGKMAILSGRSGQEALRFGQASERGGDRKIEACSASEQREQPKSGIPGNQGRLKVESVIISVRNATNTAASMTFPRHAVLMGDAAGCQMTELPS